MDAFLRYTQNHWGQVGNAKSYPLGVRQLLDFVLPVMNAVAQIPLLFKTWKNSEERRSLATT